MKGLPHIFRSRAGYAGAAVFITGMILVVSFLCCAPPLAASASYPGGTVLRDADGNVLRVSLGPGDVDCRPYYAASERDWIVKALIASEDRRFFHHHGVDFLSVARAGFQNTVYLRRVSGASTLTMQTTRLILPHPRSLFWKYVEAFRALRLELVRDKLWIISQYLNRAPFGSNLVGIEAAANGWFGKNAADLGIGEAALLAGMVQSPSRFRPDRHMDRTLKRREYVLSRMRALGFITHEQYAGARTVIPKIRRAPRPFREPFFCDWALRRITRQNDVNGTCQTESGDFITTLDSDIQMTAERIIRKAAVQKGYSVAAAVMRVETGAVVALACSDDYFSKDAGQVNTALAPRPAGSTLKPFLTALALDGGLVSPDERLSDVPMTYAGYNPANFDATHRGAVTVADALVLSLNQPFVELLQRVGLTRLGACLRHLGCAHFGVCDSDAGLGMAIGNVNVSLVELVGAYGCFAREGLLCEPAALQSEVKRSAQTQPLRIFSKGASWLVSDILSGDARSLAALGHAADVKVSRFAWKTGTSSGYRDAWTIAWNPEYVVGVWCGHKTGHFGDTSVVGARAAAPLAWELARSLYPADNGPWFTRPEEVLSRRICSDSGFAASPECPKTEEGRFLRGRTPGSLCQFHRRGGDGRILSRPGAFLSAFNNANAPVEKIKIARPADHSVFYLVRGLGQQRIVCSVVGNARNGRLWWFVDGCPSGETIGDRQFVWTPVLGTHTISCTTAEGVADSVKIQIITD